MKIIILGAGRVGESVAESLLSERNDITLIDPDAARLRALEERLDLRGVAGNGIEPGTLERAGAADADLLISCATLDETNLAACKVAHAAFNIPTTIARLRSPEFTDDHPLLGRDGFAVDHVIRPEESVVRYVERLVDYPEALQVLEFSQGRAHLVVVRAASGGALVQRRLSELETLIPSAKVQVVAVYRGDAEITSQGDPVIQPGDELFLLADRDAVRPALVAVHNADEPVRRVMIAGGGKVGLRLARRLAGRCEVKVIERDLRRCEVLATELPSRVLVLGGDGTDEELLADEGVRGVDMFLALSNDDEDNILAAMLAKRMGARRVLALINRRAYAELIEGGSIDIAVSPAQTVIGELLTHVRRGDVAAVHSLRRGAAEALEGIARGDEKTSRLVGRTVERLSLPPGVRLGAIVRGEDIGLEVVLPRPGTLIQEGDHLVFFIPDKRCVREVERLFQVSATFF
jgi:trk system potassium uptake protein TrkA